MIKFSLLVPSYNRPEFIRETVRSLSDNAAADVEIIISDDASPKRDKIEIALADFIDSGKLTYIQQENNIGPAANTNALVDAARGEYVILVGDDDRLKPGALNSLRTWTAKHPEISIFGLGYDVIDENGNRIYTFCTPKRIVYEMSKNDHWKDIFAYDVMPGWSHHPFTMCSKREIVRAIRYSERVDIAYDALFTYDALEQGHTLMAIPEILFEWRVAVNSAGTYSTLSGSIERCQRTRGLILAEWLNRTTLRKEVKSLLGDTHFLRRFCSVFKEADANQLRRLMAVRPADGKLLGEFIGERAMAARPSFFELVERQSRGIRVMGFMHLLNILRYKSDKNRLTRTLRRRATGLPKTEQAVKG
jgi:glycosyltransferase involved in cell wall biosynthesis